jgi:hypothetical protein
MSTDDLGAFYSRGYRFLQQGTEDPTEKDLAVQEARALGTVRMIAGALPSLGRHLDLGSSSGALLEAFRWSMPDVVSQVKPTEGIACTMAADLPNLAELIEVSEAPSTW